MRIWAFPSIYPYDYPGMTFMGTFAQRQYKGLVENGNEVAVILPVHWHPPFPFSELVEDWKKMRKLNYPSERVHEGVQIYYPRVENMYPRQLFRKPYQEKFISSILRFFKKMNIKLDPKKDIFLSQWIPNSIFIQEVAHILGVKSAILGIGDDVLVWPNENGRQLELFRKVYEEADARLFCANYLGMEANKLMNKNLAYHTIYFGVDYMQFMPPTESEQKLIREQYHIPENKVIVLIVGSALIRKGWLDLLDALVQVKKEHDNFVLVGGHAGPSDLNVIAEVEKRGLTMNFVNLGEIKPEALSKVYNLADIFCLPSHWEGLATVVIEAMSSGLPVITTNVCGQPEVVRDDKMGVLIPAKQVDILARELASLINDEGKRRFLGANARNFIVNNWGNFRDNAQKLSDVLAKTLS